MPLSNDPYEAPTQAATIGERADEDPTAGQELGETRLRTLLRETRSVSGRMRA